MPSGGLTLRGGDRLKRALRQAPDRVQRGVMRGMKRGMARIQRSARENTPVDTGRLRGSVTYQVRQRGDGARGVIGTAVEYAPFVEFGSRPHWPPLSAMQPWARRHGFPEGQAGAFLVARAIARHGTPATHFLRNAVKDNQRKVFQDIKREISRELDRLD